MIALTFNVLTNNHRCVQAWKSEKGKPYAELGGVELNNANLLRRSFIIDDNFETPEDEKNENKKESSRSER